MGFEAATPSYRLSQASRTIHSATAVAEAALDFAFLLADGLVSVELGLATWGNLLTGKQASKTMDPTQGLEDESSGTDAGRSLGATEAITDKARQDWQGSGKRIGVLCEGGNSRWVGSIALGQSGCVGGQVRGREGHLI